MNQILFYLHKVTRTKVLSVVGFLIVAFQAVDPALYAEYPRVKASVTVAAALIAAVGRGLLRFDSFEKNEGEN